MKHARFSSVSTRAAVVLLAGLLAASLPAAGQFSVRLGRAKISFESPTKALSEALSKQVGSGKPPAYLLPDVAGLIDRTGQDLAQAIEKVGEPDLEALHAWSAEEFRRIQEELAVPPVRTASLSSASVRAAAPKPETISAEKADGLLDQVGAVVGRIFFLAERDALEVTVWVGSTPARATFRFWTQGKLKGSAPVPTIIRTNGKRDRVLRGLYSYQITRTEGAVTKLVAYPSQAGAPAAQTASERLDLINGSSFFCCRFDEQYCQHVDDEKECGP